MAALAARTPPVRAALPTTLPVVTSTTHAHHAPTCVPGTSTRVVHGLRVSSVVERTTVTPARVDRRKW